jgi:hypothetical protein
MGITGFTGIRVGDMQTITLVNHTAQTITPPDTTDFILLEASAHDVRITFDGSNPTASVGFLLQKDTPYRIDVGLGTTLKLIATADSPACYWQAFRVKRDDNA